MPTTSKHTANAAFLAGRLDTAGLLLEWSEAPWDTAIFGFPVLQINRLDVRASSAQHDICEFKRMRRLSGAGLVSCRLPHERLDESMLLESIDFRFVEMLYQPKLAELHLHNNPIAGGLTVRNAGVEDLAAILDIAGSSFHNERFHVDPRLPSRLGDQRYQNWVRNSMSHPTQNLYAICDRNIIVAFFITEILADNTCYWHLTAVDPNKQGCGYGKRAWLAMLYHASRQGATRVCTSIAARNYRVLNLYARLGFLFPPPFMTFHWVKT
jgi:RimJ/RimL family protein N-acetyltransferase